jgi:hypothetical protein
MKNAVFWDVVPCRYFVNRRSSVTSGNKISTRRHIPENGILLPLKLIFKDEQVQGKLISHLHRDFESGERFLSLVLLVSV